MNRSEGVHLRDTRYPDSIRSTFPPFIRPLFPSYKTFQTCQTTQNNSETNFFQDQVALLSDEELPYQDKLAEWASRYHTQTPAPHHICTALAAFGEEAERYSIQTFHSIDVSEELQDKEEYQPEMQDRDNKARVTKLHKLFDKYSKVANDIYEKPHNFPIDMYFRMTDIAKSPQVFSTAGLRSSSAVIRLRALANSRNATEMKQLTKDKNISNQIRSFIKVCTLENVNGAFPELIPKTMNKDDPGKLPKFLRDPATLAMFLEAIFHEDFITGPVCYALAAVCADVNEKFREMPQLTQEDFNQAGGDPDGPPFMKPAQVGGVGAEDISLDQPQQEFGFDESFMHDEQLRMHRFSDDKEIEMLSRKVFEFEEETTTMSYVPYLIGAAVVVLILANR